MADLGTVADIESLASLVDEIASAVIPQMQESGPPRHLQTPRNEVAEILAYDALVQVLKAIIPASRIREKESPVLPTRGLDVFAMILPEYQLVICEVKASSSSASPPPVVGNGDDSMHSQIQARIRNRNSIIVELGWTLKHAKEELRTDVAKAMIIMSKVDALPPVAAPVLVRPVERHGQNDFGCFIEKPDTYHPARVNFLILRIPGSLEEFAGRVYSKARDLA